MAGYLEFVKAGVQTLLDRQSARMGGRSDGVLCITVTKQSTKTFRSLGSRRGDTFLTYLFEEQPMEMGPYLLDMGMWPALELFSDVTGDPQYLRMVVDMASAFGRHGFDPASGLGYLGAQAQFDVLRLAPEPTSIYAKPDFKPSANVPLDRLWAQAPEQTARMIKSAYYGLITRPEDVSYNRYCSYGFDDSQKRPATAFNSHHVAFAQTGAFLIHWWGYHFARTGDAECLRWAQAMADKWQAAQHPESGLAPAWFGSDRGDEPTMPPRPYCNNWDTITAISLLRAASEWKKRPGGIELARQVAGMGERLIKGMARHGYDPEARVFPQWINLNGRAREETTWYSFYSQAEKEEAVKKDPILREVPVFSGAGFYSAAPWAMGAGNGLPYDVTLGAHITGDGDLLARSLEFAAAVMEEAGKLTGPLNAQGQWTYPASASYIKMLLLLFKMTKDSRYLDGGRKLADMELEFLSRPLPSDQLEWWRMPFRDGLLESLLLLYQEER